LAVAGEEAKDACVIDQLCAGLKAGIEGAIHAIKELWAMHEQEEEWGFLLVDARNAFNEACRIAMLWTVRHKWPAGARFTFNCYRHWTILMVRTTDGTAIFLFSKEGVTQGDPLSMLVYGIGMLPLACKLKQAIPAVKQPWYADDAGAGGKFENLREYFVKLSESGPPRGYFPEPTKSILIVAEHNVETAKAQFQDLGFQVVTGSRYLGGFIGSRESELEWVREKVEEWTAGVKALAKVAPSCPQTAFCGLQKSYQHEWQHLQRVIEDVDVEFESIEEAVQTAFLPALFGLTEIGEETRALTALPVKHSGLSIPFAPKSAPINHATSAACCSHLVEAMQERREWAHADHVRAMRDGRRDAQTGSTAAAELQLGNLLKELPTRRRRIVDRGKHTGAWLSVLPTTINGTTLSAQEFRDGLLLRYGYELPDLPTRCDGCNAKFSVGHALQCKKGGMVVARHNEIRDELGFLATLATTSSSVRDEPLIHTGLNAIVRGTAAQQAGPNSTGRNEENAERGDLLIRGLWTKQTSCIVDVRVTDTDAASYASSTPEKVLRKHEQEKKKKYLESCLEQRRHFTPFVCSTDGMLGLEAKQLLKRIAGKLAIRWKTTYSQVCGYVNARMSIAILRATHLCLRGSRVPTKHISTRWSQWDDGAGLGLFRCGA
jgi:hypothetical protein